MRIMLDVESVGIKGPLQLLQLGYPDKEIKFFRHWEIKKAIEEIDKKENIIVGWNLNFDIWKLYQFLDRKKPFNFSIVDLMIHAKKNPPLSHFTGLRTCFIRKVWEPFIEVVRDFYIEKIKEKIRNDYHIDLEISVKKSLSKFKDKKKIKEKFYDLSFTIDFNLKLKSIVKILGLVDSVTMIEESGWNMPDKDLEKSFSEYDKSLEQLEFEEKLFIENEKILDDPSHRFYSYAGDDIKFLFLLDGYYKKPLPILEDKMIEILSYTKHYGFGIDHIGLSDYIEKLEAEKEETEKEESLKDYNLASSPQKKELLLSLGFSEDETEKADKEAIEELLEKKKNLISLGFEIVNLEAEQEKISILEKLAKYGGIMQRLNLAKKLSGMLRCHPDLNPIGTATGRMSGQGGLNFQGIAKEKGGLRDFFKVSQMGDFDQLELRIAGAVFQDENFLLDLSMDLHLRTATYILGCSYEEAEKRKHEERVKTARKIGKQINFALLYYAQVEQIERILRKSGYEYAGDFRELAEKIHKNFYDRYKKIEMCNTKLLKEFCTIDPENWTTIKIPMKSHISPILGDPRTFYLAKDFVEILTTEKNTGELQEKIFDLDPKIFIQEKFLDFFPNMSSKEIFLETYKEKNKNCFFRKIVRSTLKGEQNTINTLISARLGSALEIQQSCYRKAGNAQIQMVGAYLTKLLMADLWEKFKIPMLNIHDEILIPDGHKELFPYINEAVKNFCLEKSKEIKDLKLTMEWQEAKFWSEKK